jgi:NAD(P)-dependent dehydrogenase (short-subunit alcohol dehydrogenase family)
MPDSSPKTVLIVGASRGLGYAMAEEYAKRGWRVIGTVRGERRTPLHELEARSGGQVEIEQIDINKPDQIDALRARLAGRTLDLLFVNSGISGEHPEALVSEVSTEEFTEVMVTNALNPMRVVEALQDLVPPSGVIGVMSSGLGSVANNTNARYETYRASKASLNTFMRSFAARHAQSPRAMAVVAPGWVRTDLGGPHAPLGVEDSIPKVVDVLTAIQGKAGLQYLDYQGHTVPW